MADTPKNEQRRRPRINRPFIVRYRPASTEDAKWFVSPLRDLSGGGARFVSEYPFFVGDTFELQLLLQVPEQPL